jgi:serine protease Do
MADIDRSTSKSGVPFDPYNFSEIEKIQLDIERDLSVSEEVHEEAATHEAAHEPLDSADSYKPVTLDSPAIIQKSLAEYPDSFYKETIKQAEPSFFARLRPQMGKIMLFLLACTIGTGTLGLGIGFGLARFGYQLGFINSYISEDSPYEADNTIENTRIIFGIEEGAAKTEGSLSDVVKLVDPSVVSITTMAQGASRNPFFGGSSGVRQRDGSGIIIGQDSELLFILTNHHVVRGAESVYVSIMESEPIRAMPAGSDTNEDISIISVYLADVREAGIRNISIAVFGDSDAVEVGDVVLAIGNAMGEGNSTTSGIISAGEREINIDGRDFRVIQTDAAINPGSSGGPLVNKQGQVIGIITDALSLNHFAIEGMGFTIPSNVVKPVIEAIMSRTPRPVIGILGFSITEEIAAEYGILPIGVFVDTVFENTGAAAAGMQRGDIITNFNGQVIFDMEQLVEEILSTDIGDIVEVTILRRAKDRMVLNVTIGEDSINNF